LFDLSSYLLLSAVFPGRVVVRRPHEVSGMMALIAARITLGASGLVSACPIVLAISAGLLLGLGLLGVSLPPGVPGREVPIWLDVISAGVAVAAFSIFFSMPLRMLGWPVAVGMAAHALRWSTLAIGDGPALVALV